MTIFDVMSMICGLALFLYGMQLMSESLKKSAGGRLKAILSKMTSSPLRGFLLGLGVTAIIQSSSATTVMIVGFVNSGTMALTQSIGVIMGANVGAAVTFWLTGLSGLGGNGAMTNAIEWLKPSSWMPILAITGMIMMMVSKRGKKHDIGAIFLGFSILMVGMDLMGSSVSGLKESPEFTHLMTVFNNPVLGILIGTVVTAIIQSSAASVGILQSLSTTGLISYETAIPIIMGQNIGTCITALLSSFGAGKNGKRAAIIHLLFNVIGSFFWLGVFVAVEAVVDMPFLKDPIDMFGIAGVHTVFKLLSVLLMAPFYRYLEKLSKLIIRDEKGSVEESTANRLDERLMNTPSVAVARATEVTNEMAHISVEALKLSIDMLDHYDPKVAEEIRNMESKVDEYEDELGSYLVKVAACSMEEADSHQITMLLHMIGDFERISDHSVNIVESAEEMKEKKLEFSDEAKHELGVLVGATREILSLSEDAFCHTDLVKATRVEPLEQVVDYLKDQIKHNHILRLQKSECTIEHGFVLSDLLTNFERVSDHCSNIAGCVIEISEHDALDMHRYLHDVKKGKKSFEDMFKDYKEKYAL